MRILNIVGDSFRHCGYSNNPYPPINVYPNIKWSWEQQGSGELIVLVDNAVYQVDNIPSQTKIAWLLEPMELLPSVYQFVLDNHMKFKYVLTHEKTLLDMNRNFQFIPFGGCWVESENRNVYKKTKLVSIISSNKRMLSGHRLRHLVIERNNLDVFGGGYNPIPHKLIGLRDYMFSVVIENCKRDFWFTEKIIDCFVTGTAPIYWGCPSIDQFFNPKGLIQVDGLDDIEKVLKEISPEVYNDMLPYIEENFELAKRYILAEQHIDEQFIQTGKL
jgi:hypothetical protein